MLQSAFAKPVFTELLYNPKWARTYDSSSQIIPADGQLLFAWNYQDAAKHTDSFYVGIDTLWWLPQDVDADTANDWDLQVCPDEQCMLGLKANVHGANAPFPFGDTKFKSEHHFQFFPAISKKFDFTAPKKSLFGGMMYCRSRSTGEADTVLGYGAWNMVWDSAFLPPVRPVAGKLPKRSDFVISGDTVRYMPFGAGISFASIEHKAELNITQVNGDLHIYLDMSPHAKEISIYNSNGKLIISSGILSGNTVEWIWSASKENASLNGQYILRLKESGRIVSTQSIHWLR